MSHTDALTPLLDRQIAAFGQLLAVLGEEQETLLQQDTAALEAAVARKRGLLGQAAALEGERIALLRAARLPDNREGMAALIAAQDDPESAGARWEQLLGLAAENRERNRLNGGIVELGLHQLQRTLNVLRGQAPEPPVYGPRGRTRNGVSGRSLAHA